MQVLSRLLDKDGQRAYIGPGTIVSFNFETHTLSVMQAMDGLSGLYWSGADTLDNKVGVYFIRSEQDFKCFMILVSEFLGLTVTPGPKFQWGWAVTFAEMPMKKEDPNVVVTGD